MRTSYFVFKAALIQTRLFKNGNSQAVRIPAELAYSQWDLDLVIERRCSARLRTFAGTTP